MHVSRLSRQDAARVYGRICVHMYQLWDKATEIGSWPKSFWIFSYMLASLYRNMYHKTSEPITFDVKGWVSYRGSHHRLNY